MGYLPITEIAERKITSKQFLEPIYHFLNDKNQN